MKSGRETDGKDDHVRPVHSAQAARWTLLVLTVIALWLVALIVKPFASALFVAAVMAGALHPWFDRLAARLRGRRQTAAGLTTAAVLLVVVLPLAVISVVLAKEVGDGAAYVRRTLQREGVEGLVNDLPRPLRALAEKVRDQLPKDSEDVALVPAVGAGGVCLAAVAIMYLGGHPYSALFLALWGVLAVGLIDNVIKPYLIRGGMELHGAVVFFSLVGGLAYFGPIGLLAGPLIISFFLAVVRLWDRDQPEPRSTAATSGLIGCA